MLLLLSCMYYVYNHIRYSSDLVSQQSFNAVVAMTLQVLRDKQVKSMDAVEIVPGDILVVRLGDIVPADIKILGEHAEDEEEAPMQVRAHSV